MSIGECNHFQSDQLLTLCRFKDFDQDERVDTNIKTKCKFGKNSFTSSQVTENVIKTQ